MAGRKIVQRTHDREIGRLQEELCRANEVVQKLSRRNFLAGGIAAAGVFLNPFGFFGAGQAMAAETKQKRAVSAAAGNPSGSGKGAQSAVKTGLFVFPRLQFTVKDNTPDRWNVHPVGDVNLKQKLRELTNINVSQETKVVRLADFDDMVRHPFVFMTSEGRFDLPPQENRNFREYLERGGFVLADDCVYRDQDLFFQDYFKLINNIFPENPMREIPREHEIFHCYFDFPEGAPHMQGRRYGQTNAAGLFERGTGRLMTFACPGDLHCGWVCRFWPMPKNMEAIKMGVNIIIYFLSH